MLICILFFQNKKCIVHLIEFVAIKIKHFLEPVLSQDLLKLI